MNKNIVAIIFVLLFAIIGTKLSWKSEAEVQKENVINQKRDSLRRKTLPISTMTLTFKKLVSRDGFFSPNTFIVFNEFPNELFKTNYRDSEVFKEGQKFKLEYMEIDNEQCFIRGYSDSPEKYDFFPWDYSVSKTYENLCYSIKERLVNN